MQTLAPGIPFLLERTAGAANLASLRAMSVVILEGVTGCGKSSTVKALQAIAPFRLYGEDLTFDDFMTEFWKDPDEAGRRASLRLTSMLDEIEKHPEQQHLLERFHFSAIAVGSDPAWYGEVNDRCSRLQCKTAVLTIPEEQLRYRALNRREYDGEDWQSLIPRYGSEEEALSVLRCAQDRRVEAVEASGLEFCLVDTSAMAWAQYARRLARWARWI